MSRCLFHMVKILRIYLEIASRLPLGSPLKYLISANVSTSDISVSMKKSPSVRFNEVAISFNFLILILFRSPRSILEIKLTDTFAFSERLSIVKPSFFLFGKFYN